MQPGLSVSESLSPLLSSESRARRRPRLWARCLTRVRGRRASARWSCCSAARRCAVLHQLARWHSYASRVAAGGGAPGLAGAQRGADQQGWPRRAEARTRDSRLAESPKWAPRASRLARLGSLTLFTGSREADSTGCPQVLRHDFESTASCCLNLGLSWAKLS